MLLDHFISTDINECAAINNGRGLCQYGCSNTCGSFCCSCGPGYMSNGFGCDGMNHYCTIVCVIVSNDFQVYDTCIFICRYFGILINKTMCSHCCLICIEVWH